MNGKARFLGGVALAAFTIVAGLRSTQTSGGQTPPPSHARIGTGIQRLVKPTAGPTRMTPAATPEGKTLRGPAIQRFLAPTGAPVQTQLRLYQGSNNPVSPGEFGDLAPGGVKLSASGAIHSTTDIVQFGWTVTLPASVKKGRWEVAGIAEAGTPQWTAGQYPPLAGSGEAAFLPKPDGWSLFTIDFAGIFAAKNFDWRKANAFVVRITPLNANGSPAGPPSGPPGGYVVLSNNLMEQKGIATGSSKSPKASAAPVIAADHFTPDANLNLGNGENTTSEYGPELHMKVTRAPEGPTELALAKFYGVSKPGDKFVIGLAPPSQDVEGFEAVAGFIGDAVEFIEKPIDFASGQFAALKADLVSAVAVVVQDPKIAEALVMVAMSYCGIPPALPNSKDLQNAGSDYIMDYAAEQAGVEAPDEVKGQLKQSVSQMNDKVAAQQNARFAATFYAPDSDYFYRPPVLYLRASFTPTVAYSHLIGAPTGGALAAGAVPYSHTTDPKNDKLKDSTLHGDDTVPGGRQTPSGLPKGPTLPYGNGQNVGEPSTGSSSTGGAPTRSDKCDIDVAVTAHLDWKTIQEGQFGNNYAVENPVVFVAHVHVPPLRAGESILIPVPLRFGPMATSADIFERKAWYTGWGYDVNAIYEFKIGSSVIKEPLHKPWSG